MRTAATTSTRKTRSILEVPAGPNDLGPLTEGAPLSSVIERENLDDKIYAQLRSLIESRRLLPGHRIPVDRLAREMGVSRTPVGNALKRLAQERVVEWISHRGVYVRRLTKRELTQILEIREVLEGLAARLAASRISPEEADQLTAMFKSLDLTPHGPSVRRYTEKDRQFHMRLLQIAGSPPLLHVVTSVHLMIFTYQLGLFRPPAETIQEHLAILSGLRKRDPEASEAAMRLHIRRSLERLKQEAEAEEPRSGRIRPAPALSPTTAGLAPATPRGQASWRRR